MNRPTCKTCVFFEGRQEPDITRCRRNPKPVEVTELGWCGEHDQFKKWYAFQNQNQFRVDVASVKTKAELDAMAKAQKPAPLVAVTAPKEPLKVHASLQDVDTSGVLTKEDTGEPVKPAASIPALGQEICAECNEVIVNQTCKCGRIH